MLFAAGARVAHLGLFAAAAAPALAAVAIMEPYRLKRLTSFLDCRQDALGDGFQLCQALIAFGSGGLWGVGLGQGQQKMYYLPAAHTDFIFSVIGEELGLVGAGVVLALFALVGRPRAPHRGPPPGRVRVAARLRADRAHRRAGGCSTSASRSARCPPRGSRCRSSPTAARR